MEAGMKEAGRYFLRKMQKGNFYGRTKSHSMLGLDQGLDERTGRINSVDGLGRGKTGKVDKAGQWDGLTEYRRVTLADQVIKVMERNGTGERMLWFTHRAIYNRMVENGINNADGVRLTLAHVIFNLVRLGYVQRALKTPKMGKQKYRVLSSYVYRRTSKPYKPSVKTFPNRSRSVVDKGLELYLNNPKFPKWFRDMLH